jgi:hypothetical protein
MHFHFRNQGQLLSRAPGDHGNQIQAFAIIYGRGELDGDIAEWTPIGNIFDYTLEVIPGTGFQGLDG